MIARFAAVATRRALIGGLCAGLAIVPTFADSMLPIAALAVGLGDADNQDDEETHRGRLASVGPGIPCSVPGVLKPSLVTSIKDGT